jgi:hypothetical protein
MSSEDLDLPANRERERRIKELRRSEFYLAEGQRLAHMGSWSFTANGEGANSGPAARYAYT